MVRVWMIRQQVGGRSLGGGAVGGEVEYKKKGQ